MAEPEGPEIGGVAVVGPPRIPEGKPDPSVFSEGVSDTLRASFSIERGTVGGCPVNSTTGASEVPPTATDGEDDPAVVTVAIAPLVLTAGEFRLTGATPDPDFSSCGFFPAPSNVIFVGSVDITSGDSPPRDASEAMLVLWLLGGVIGAPVGRASLNFSFAPIALSTALGTDS